MSKKCKAYSVSKLGLEPADNRKAFYAGWDAALAEQPAQQQEPVAWTLTKTLTERETTTRGYLWFSDPQNCMWTPLYTSPPASKPLTDEQVDAIALDVMGFTVLDKEQAETARMLIRSAEAAHGIKESRNEI